MNRTKYYTAAIVLLMASLFAADASAGWGRHRSRHFGGYYGGWGGYYGGGWGGVYSVGWRGHHRRAWRGYYGGGWGGYYGSRWGVGYSPYSYGVYAVARPSYAYYNAGGLYGSYGYGCTSCYSSAAYTPTVWASPVYSCAPIQCGCVDACGCGGAVTGTVIDDGYQDDGYQEDTQDQYIDEAPEEQPMPAPASPSDAKKQKPWVRNSIVLAVSVPTDAKLFVNDYETKATGEQRKFRSSRLDVGESYTYRVKAVHEGRTITKFVTATPGQQAKMSFDFESRKNASTVLKLNVPKSARVTLNGVETDQQGMQRVYATRQLPAGQAIDDYVVSVSIEKDGRTLTQDRTISLAGGESHEMQFDFQADYLASK